VLVLISLYVWGNDLEGIGFWVGKWRKKNGGVLVSFYYSGWVWVQKHHTADVLKMKGWCRKHLVADVLKMKGW
jgi:hypothetical protein